MLPLSEEGRISFAAPQGVSLPIPVIPTCTNTYNFLTWSIMKPSHSVKYLGLNLADGLRSTTTTLRLLLLFISSCLAHCVQKEGRILCMQALCTKPSPIN